MKRNDNKKEISIENKDDCHEMADIGGCESTGNARLFTLSIDNAIVRMLEAIRNLALAVAPAIKTYQSVKYSRFTFVVDEKTAYWNKKLITDVERNIKRFYHKYRIQLEFNVIKTKGIKSLPFHKILRQIGNDTNIYLLDEFSDCKDCVTKGYWDGRVIRVTYNQIGNNPSPYLWVSIAHEIGHAYDLPHEGTRNNLMNESGPMTNTVEGVILTCLQVYKIKRSAR